MPTFPYVSFDKHTPPAPALEAQLAKPRTNTITTALFLVDCGADITSIKDEIFDLLDLEYYGAVRLSGIMGNEETRLTTVIRIETPWGGQAEIEAVVDPDSQENLLGRDVINTWKVLLNGPQLELTIEI